MQGSTKLTAECMAQILRRYLLNYVMKDFFFLHNVSWWNIHNVKIIWDIEHVMLRMETGMEIIW